MIETSEPDMEEWKVGRVENDTKTDKEIRSFYEVKWCLGRKELKESRGGGGFAWEP